MFSESKILFLLVIVLVLFGGKKLPELARGLGRSISEFKKGTREMESELSAQVDMTPTTPPPVSPFGQGALPTAPPAPQPAAQAYRFDPYTGKPLAPDAPQHTTTTA